MLRFALLVLAAIAVVQCSRVKRHFDRYDRNFDGELDHYEVRACGCLGLKVDSSEIDKCVGRVDPDQVDIVMEMLDLDKSGTVSYDEFRNTLPKKLRDPIEGQVHLATTINPTEMVVMWITRYHDAPILHYGKNPSRLSLIAKGSSATYNVGIDGWRGWIHKVTLTGLDLNSLYYYVVGQSNNQSEKFHFRTPTVPISPNATVSFAVVADMGTTIPMGWYVTDRIVSANKKTPFAMVIHAGDVCYAGTGSELELEEVWDLWGDQMQPLAAYVPYMFAVGNHEHYYDYTSFNTRYTMPGPQSGGNGNFWYSIEYAHVHFTFMSTEHPYAPGTDQYKWIEQDFVKAVANRKTHPWIILVGHRPMYNSDVAEWDSHKPGAPFQTQIEPLMVKYGVDMYLSGHMHMYERTYPLINGNSTQKGNVYTNPKAPVHVVQATAGVFLDDAFEMPQPAWSASRTNKWGYGNMVVNQTHISYQFVGIWESEIHDQIWIVKQRVGLSWPRRKWGRIFPGSFFPQNNCFRQGAEKNKIEDRRGSASLASAEESLPLLASTLKAPETPGYSKKSAPLWAWVVLLLSVASMSSGGTWFALLHTTPPVMKACWRLSLTVLMQIPGFCYECYTHNNRDPTLLRKCLGSSPRMIMTGVFLGAHFAFWSWGVDHTSLTHSLLFVSSGPLIIVVRSTLVYLLSLVFYSRQRRRCRASLMETAEFEIMTELDSLDDGVPKNPANLEAEVKEKAWWRKILSLSTYISPDSYPPTLLEFVGTLLGFSGAALLVLKSGQEHPAENEVPLTIEGDFASFLGALTFVFLLDAGSTLRQWMPLFIYAFPVTLSASVVLGFSSMALEGTTLLGLNEYAWFGWAAGGPSLWYSLGGATVAGMMGHLLCYLALQHVTPLVVSIVCLFEPLVGSFFGWLVDVQGVPGLWTLLAGSMLMLGAILVTFGDRTHKYDWEACIRKVRNFVD